MALAAALPLSAEWPPGQVLDYQVLDYQVFGLASFRAGKFLV